MPVCTTGRVSKGVFVIRGKRKTVQPESLKRYDEADGKDKVDPERLELFDEVQEKANENIQLMQTELNSKIFDDLVAYIKVQYPSNGASGSASESEQVNRLCVAEIPTAALVTGINTSDHGIMFGNLVTLLRQKITSYIAVLKSKDCANLRAMINSTVTQIMENADFVEDDEETEVQAQLGHRVIATLSILKHWYQENMKQKIMSPKRSPSKRKSNGSPKEQVANTIPEKHSPPIVLVIEDLESFTPVVLQDFITICSRHVPELPIVFVFGIATTVAAVHRILPQHISSLLCMEKFQAPPSTNYLSHVVKQLVMAPEMPFKLGGKMFNLLIDLFLYHDFSVLRFIQGYQAAMLDHFHSNPASILCVHSSDVEYQVSGLSSTQLDTVRSTMSFRTYVESRPPDEQIKLLEDDEYTKSTVKKFLSNLHDYNQCLIPVLQCIHSFVAKLPGQPLGIRLREIYAMVLEQNLQDVPEHAEAMMLLQAMSRDEMITKLEECCLTLEHESCHESLREARVKMTEFLRKFQGIEQLMKDGDHEEVVEEEESSAQPTGSTPNPLPQKFHQLKEKLMGMEKKKKKLTVYEVLRNDTIDYLQGLFKKYLISPAVFPLHEVLYYNNSAAIKRHIIGQPRSVLENALSTPHYYLHREDLMGDGTAILPTLPDVCIVYKLHQECGRLINLYDWLQAFVTIVNAGSENEEKKENNKDMDQILQARFIRAVSELEFLGFIKSTKRKTDHVARLTWGAC